MQTSHIQLFNRGTFNAVIFDMDGVLVDTESLAVTAWTSALLEHGYDFPPLLQQEIVGLDATQRERVFKKHLGAAFPFQRIFSRRLEIGDKLEQAQGVPAKPGAKEILELLYGLGIPLGLATGTSRARAERRLTYVGLLQFFSASVCGGEVENGKPWPDIFLAVAAKLKTPTTNCLVIEDSEPGLRAAVASGASVVVVPDIATPSEAALALAFGIYDSLPKLQSEIRSGVRPQANA